MKNKIFVAILSLVFGSTTFAGVKNVQEVFGGLLTRAGVSGQRPLSKQELTNLCEQGFTEAFFLYRGAGDQVVSCGNGTLRYRSPGDFRAPSNINLVLESIYNGFTKGTKTFVHCNNGAHATGFVSAVALRTFCGISANEAILYWDRSLGGYPLQEPNRSSLMKRLRNYPVRQDLELSPSEKVRFGCPR